MADVECSIDLPLQWRLAGFILLAIYLLIAIPFNTLLYIVMMMSKKLRQRRYRILCFVTVSDLLISLLCVPMEMVDSGFYGQDLIPAFVLKVWNSFVFTMFTMATLSYFVVSMDRFAAVSFPLGYPRFEQWSQPLHAAVILAVYVTSIFTLLLTTQKRASPSSYVFIIPKTLYLYILLTTTILLLASLSVNLHVCRVANRQRKKLIRTMRNIVWFKENSNREWHKEMGENALPGLPQSSTANGSASLREKRQELRSALSLLLVVLFSSTTWCPYIVLHYIWVLDSEGIYCLPMTGEKVISWVFYLSTVVNPLLYAIPNQVVRREIQDFLGTRRIKRRGDNATHSQ